MPISLLEALEADDALMLVQAMRYRIAAVMDDPGTPGSALAPLARVMRELTTEYDRLCLDAEANQPAGLRLVEPFDVSMI